MPEPQNFKNHARMHPPFHFVLLPILLLNLIFAIAATIHHWPTFAPAFIWWIILSVALFLAVGLTREYSLKVQTRVIRLEERLRLMALLPASEHADIYKLTESQIVGLRFASDAELPALFRRTLKENLSNKQIKASIESWRPDYFRV